MKKNLIVALERKIINKYYLEYNIDKEKMEVKEYELEEIYNNSIIRSFLKFKELKMFPFKNSKNEILSIKLTDINTNTNEYTNLVSIRNYISENSYAKLLYFVNNILTVYPNYNYTDILDIQELKNKSDNYNEISEDIKKFIIGSDNKGFFTVKDSRYFLISPLLIETFKYFKKQLTYMDKKIDEQV